MSRLLIGLSELTGSITRYAERFGVVELHPVDAALPGQKTLRKWRAAVSPAFAFSVVLPRVVGALGTGDAVDEAIKISLAAARAVEAGAIVLATPPTVRPTPKNRELIAALAARVRRDGHVVAWQPSGLWTEDAALEVASENGLLLVLDVSQSELPPGPIVYTRIRSLGRSARLGADAIDRIGRRLAGRKEAFVLADESLGRALVRALPDAVARHERGGTVPQLFRATALFEAEDEEQ